jgi:outer membrane protein TolC
MVGFMKSHRKLLLVLGLAALGLTARVPSATAQAVLGAPVPTPAGPVVRKLTLDEARQIALNGNKALILARLNVAEKKYGIDAARKDYFPKLLGSVTYFRFNDDLGSVVSTKRSIGPLPAGRPLASVAVLNQDSALSTIFVAQPITKLIAVNAAVQLARADEGAARAQLDKGARDVLSGVAQAYHGLLGAQRIQTALQLQIQLLEQLSKVKPAPELKVALVEARQGLAQVREQVQELTQLLNDLLDLPGCTVLELVDPLPPALPLRCADDAANLAVVYSPEVREAEASVGKAEAALKIAKMDYLPDVNIVGGYANQQIADYVQPNIGYVGVTANVMFWGWGKRRDVKLQRETLVAVAHQNVEVSRSKVALEARKAFVAFEQAREAYQLAREMVVARRELEKSAQGPAAILQAKGDTSKAELEVMKAEIAYRVAHAQLSALIGRE